MGLGGDLMYTAVVREVKMANSESNVFLFDGEKKGLIEKILEKKYIRNSSPVFNNNPYLSQGWVGGNDIVIDRTDSNNHYVKKELSDRYFWKDQKHIVELICENFGVVPKSIEPDLIFSENEIKENSQKMVLPEEDFITVEPNGKTDYFAQNRLWFFDRWQELINQLSEFTQIIQVGDDNGKSLSNVINLNGNLTFREATWVISQSRLFVSTIGGLMHAARAVETKSVILYAGTEKNKMAGYSDNINMTKYVECSPCGLKVECPYGKECMDFSVEEIYEKVLENIIDARK